MSDDITAFPIHTYIVADLPDLGAVTDASSVVGELAGTGRFMAPAFRDYAIATADTLYLKLSGGVLTGALTVGGNGTTYSVAGTPAHAMAFGWDGSKILGFVDGTNIGGLATQSYVTGIAGGYLPLAGGTETGLVTFQANPTGLSVTHNATISGSVSAASAAVTATTQSLGLYSNGVPSVSLASSIGNNLPSLSNLLVWSQTNSPSE